MSLLGLTRFLAIKTALESEGRTDIGIRRVVVVGSAIAVDITEVRGALTTQHANTKQCITKIKLTF